MGGLAVLLVFLFFIAAIMITKWLFKPASEREDLPALENGFMIYLLLYHMLMFFIIYEFGTSPPNYHSGNGNPTLIIMVPEGILFASFILLLIRKGVVYLLPAARWAKLAAAGCCFLICLLCINGESNFSRELLKIIGDTHGYNHWYNWWQDFRMNSLYFNVYTFMGIISISLCTAALLSFIKKPPRAFASAG